MMWFIPAVERIFIQLKNSLFELLANTNSIISYFPNKTIVGRFSFNQCYNMKSKSSQNVLIVQELNTRLRRRKILFYLAFEYYRYYIVTKITDIQGNCLIILILLMVLQVLVEYSSKFPLDTYTKFFLSPLLIAIPYP